MSLKSTERQLAMYVELYSEILNPDHELLQAARVIDWDGLEKALRPFYSPLGRQGKPIRLMVGIHILKHRYNVSDEQAVESLQENAYWQCFCGYPSFQKGPLLEATSLVKFRNRIGPKGLEAIETVLLQAWQSLGLVKTKRLSLDTTAQPKHIAYPTDADLLHRVREQIVKQVKRARREVALRKPFRSFSRTSKKVLLQVKKFQRNDPAARAASLHELGRMTRRVVYQAERIVNTLYARGHQALGRGLNQVVSLGKKVVTQTEQVLAGEKPVSRIYALHERKVAAIKKGKSHVSCEFGALVSLAMNEDGLILAHREYQQNVADVQTLGPLMVRYKKTTGRSPKEVSADRGFDQSSQKQINCCRRWQIERLAVPKKGRKPHPNSNQGWFKKALKRRVKIEPVIGHLKNDHRLNRCRYKGVLGDTANVVWATLAWNTKKIISLYRNKKQKDELKSLKKAA
jgi:transposase, IS5 family